MARGKLFAVGGALELSPQNIIIKRYLLETGGADSRIVIVPSYFSSEEKLSQLREMHVEFFKSLGIDEIAYCRPYNGKFEDSLEYINALEKATGIFITGGRQVELHGMLRGTKFFELLRKRVKEDSVPILGTSAGCASLSEIIILRGELVHGINLGAGFGFHPNILLDQHFSSGNFDHRTPRLSRLVSILYEYPKLLGIGVDENTCALINPDDTVEVLGEGTVTALDARAFKDKVLSDDVNVLLSNDVDVKIYSNGDTFEIKAPFEG